ncbi:MAG: bifunctional protein-serine/threonine kinase/phosphatase [Alphaproteobacteria bacterium]|nr:MAG: bifunctional protein-serine/threonine kinase/phosphatase [Alphaproteobacteria bacterium]
MPGELQISIGQHSDKGRKQTNQDFHGALTPGEPLLSLKGIAIVLADGISSSNVSHIASESAVKSFLTDYYCTSESWSVKTSAQRVLAATNSWLHSQTRRSQYSYDRDKGYVCTLSAMVIKSTTAHIFHVGDSRIYRLSGNALEQLTEDHRLVVSSEQNYLSRALGINPQIEIDYQALQIEKGDLFLLATDGVYEHAMPRFIAGAINQNPHDLDRAAKLIVDHAFERGSVDNLTVQIVRIDELPDGEASEVFGHSHELPLPPLLEARAVFDGYRIVRELHGSARSHIYLAVDTETDAVVALKIPSIDLRGDPAYLKRFMMEEWVARRIDSPHVLKPCLHSRKRNYLYVATEFIDGQTLTQWMIDHPKPELETVRGIVEQIARGLRAFHRKEMLHQDIRPDNIMIDKTGTAKIIDFGSTKITGVAQTVPSDRRDEVLGTVQYTAPEYFQGESGSSRSDMFSLGVITYQMLTGKLPYGSQVAKARTRSQFSKLRYNSATDYNAEIQYLNASATPLIERNPRLFWKLLAAILACIILLLLISQHGIRH